MAKKRKKDTQHPMEKYIRSLIDEILDEREKPMEKWTKDIVKEAFDSREIKLKEEEARLIIKEILPELDYLVSRQVKEHFKILANLLVEKFSEGD
jgi:hypothetical protein